MNSIKVLAMAAIEFNMSKISDDIRRYRKGANDTFLGGKRPFSRTSISSEKRSNFQRATRAEVTAVSVELATLAEPTDDGNLSAYKF